MKRKFLGLCAAALLLACAEQSQPALENQAIDSAKFAALSVATPDATLDGTNLGMYRGIFVSADTKYHGELIVSITDADTPLAVVALDNGKSLYFEGQALGDAQYRFKSDNAFFTIDVSDKENVIVLGSDLESRPIHILLVKDEAASRATVSLGTFVDTADSSFAGTWDFISTSTSDITQPIPFPPFTFTITVDNIDELVICYDNGTPDGRMFNDTSQESFTASGCGVIPAGTYAPFTLGPTVLDLPLVGPTAVDEIAAFGQTTDILGNNLTWNLGSTINGAVPGAQAYVDLSCTEVASGTWSWNGRSGTILLD